jgi:hypothetical protein
MLIGVECYRGTLPQHGVGEAIQLHVAMCWVATLRLKAAAAAATQVLGDTGGVTTADQRSWEEQAAVATP